MMKNRILLAAIGAFCLPALPSGAADTAPASPQLAQAAQPGPIAFEQIPAELRRADEAVLNKALELQAVMETEAAEKRFPEVFAQQIRTELSQLKPPLALNVDAFAQALPVSGNAPLGAAVNELREAWQACQQRRKALIGQAIAGAKDRLAKTSRTARNADDVTVLLSAIYAIDEAATKRLLSGSEELRQWKAAIALNALLAARASFQPRCVEDLEYLSTLYRRLDNGGKDFSAFEARVYEPFAAAEKATQQELDAALIERKDSQVTYRWLLDHEEAEGHRAHLDSALTSYNSDPTLGSYRALANLAWRVEAHRWEEARQTAANLPSLLARFKDGRKERFIALLAQWNTEIAAPTEARLPGGEAKLKADLAKVQNARDLAAIATGLKATATAGGDGNPPIVATLTSLAAAWKNLRPTQPLLKADDSDLRELGLAANDVANLRRRIDLEIWSQRLQAPALTQPPADRLSPEIAIQSLCSGLAKEGNWPRLFEVVSQVNALTKPPEKGPLSATALDSLRAFVAAGNFELAEEWVAAATGYKTVLRNNLDGTPVAEAKRRLELLEKEHPAPEAR